MATITFDTHQFVRGLTSAGLSAEQAEAIADAFKEAQADSQPVTREYFDSHLKAEIEAAKADIIKGWRACSSHRQQL